MKVIIDQYNLTPHEKCFQVSDDSSYIEARKRILAYKLGKEQNQDIAVSKHPYSSWFFDIENENSPKLENLLPSKILKQKHKEIDPDLNEKDIIELNLLNETVTPTEIYLINKFIGDFLLKDASLKQLLYKACAFLTNPPKEFEVSLYLKKKWYKFFDKVESDSAIIQKLIFKVKEANKDVCKVLHLLLYVSNSRFLLQEYIHDNRAYLESVLQSPIHDLEKLLLDSNINLEQNELLEATIETRYKSLYNSDLKMFFNEHGGYKSSLSAFLSLTKSLTNEQRDFIFTYYEKSIDYELENTIKSLIKPKLTPPPFMEGLTLTAQIQSWQTWAVEYFIPYKFYLDEAQEENEYAIMEDYANLYSDWLYKNYGSIIQNSKKTNYNITRIINDSLNEFKVIWLIIDGFPAVYTDLLQSVLRSNGINKIDTEFHFAALPTITSIGIPTQLCGTTPQSESFTLNRKEGLENSFKGKHVTFNNAVSSFQGALETEYDICCLHWADIDKFMHEEDSQVEGKRSDEVKRLLEIRIKQIAKAIRSASEKRIKLFISSDHGSTKCLIKSRTIRNSTILQASRDNPKERCIELTDNVLNTQIDEEEVYYLKAEETLNNKNWAIARGYRYFGRFDYGYRHGGLTPEETIVPMLCCEINQDEIFPLKVNYAGLYEIQLGFTETFRLTIQNENDAFIQIYSVSVSEDKNAMMEIKEQIDPLSVKLYEGKIKLPKSLTVIDGKAEINVTIAYSMFGVKYTKNFCIQTLIKKSVNDSLDNLFS